MITVNVSGLFPDGTTVGVYEGVRFDSGHLSPVGEPITQAVVGDGEVIFTELTEDGTTYTMAALIGKEWTAGYLTTSAPSGLTVVQLLAQVEDHEAQTTTAHGGIVADGDPRLDDAREPTAHAASHKTAGGDALTPGDIGAASAAEVTAEKEAREAADALRQLTSQKGSANGYASLEAAGKVPAAQLPSAVMEYQGAWNASTNTPTLADGSGSAGDVYRVSVAATRNLGSGAIEFAVGDYAIYNGATWEKSDTTDAVASVAGKKGAVTLEVADVTGAEATANKDTDTTLAANSDTKYPSQKAIKAYVDAVANAAVDSKISVRAATTANVTIATALNNGDSLDGVTLATGDRVLVKDQTTKKENGIWVVGVSPARASDADAAGELSGGVSVYVEEGTRNKRRIFTVLTPGSITPGTTEHEWGQLQGRDFGLVEALPTSEAVKGDRCSYIADKTNGVVWNLVYDGEGEFPWKSSGGAALSGRADLQRSLTNAAYTNLPTDPISVTVPLKGDYNIKIEGELLSTGENRGGSLSYTVGATAASDNWAASIFGASAQLITTSSLETPHTGVAAGANIEEKAKCGGAYEIKFGKRRLWVRPVRVG